MAIAAPSNLLQAAGGYLRPLRGFGGVYPDAVIEEAHYDSVQMTEHPVEHGASITDHAFVRPKDLIIWCGWSASVEGAGLLVANPLGEFPFPQVNSGSYLQESYNILLAMMEAREPIEVLTGKRYYPRMLITSISVTTDRRTEYALIATIRMRELIWAYTKAAELPAKYQADASRTGEVQNYGAKQPIPGPAGLNLGGT